MVSVAWFTRYPEKWLHLIVLKSVWRVSGDWNRQQPGQTAASNSYPCKFARPEGALDRRVRWRLRHCVQDEQCNKSQSKRWLIHLVCSTAAFVMLAGCGISSTNIEWFPRLSPPRYQSALRRQRPRRRVPRPCARCRGHICRNPRRLALQSEKIDSSNEWKSEPRAESR